MAESDKWERVQQIFLAVADLNGTERAAVLERMCEGDAGLRGEVESLLEAEVNGAAHMHTAIQTEAAAMVDASGREGRRVGAYRLIREIGRGGMGTVYLAMRADGQYESEAAIKLVRPGLDIDFIFRRFRHERQILANMQHPNIARLLDAGTTNDQLPYLVMEYVKGSWITNYAEEHKLSVEQRLRLFLPVCSAVAYAHRAFIVHRDLKPANILIDAAGSPKLLDFGISKLLIAGQADPAETQAGMMTPDYASPEQIVGDPVTVASDVYSLGAVLYELLTGVKPHRIEQSTPLALERAICLEPSIAPSVAVKDRPALARRLAGDLDDIVLCAMRKEPERRYASAEHLADDVKRHLEHRRVMARPDSPAYRTARFLRRYRLAIALAGGAASVTAGIAVVVTYEERGRHRAAATELAAAEEQLGDLLLARGDRAAAADAYRKAKAAAEAVLAGDPNDPSAGRRRQEVSRKLALTLGTQQ
jgi:hypothetical protein